ncbi:MAG: hypothetical protein K2N16_05670 [Muribaculaceae bacterium]|nr:hypothetical protein [Muribaculaceae bacterium]
MHQLINDLVPIFICVVLPVSIVLIYYLASINRENKRAKVLIKAIEANNNIDADKLAEAMRKPKKSAREILNRRLMYGCLFTALGLALLIFGTTYSFPLHMADEHNFIMFSSVVCLGIGVGFVATYFFTRKSVDK